MKPFLGIDLTADKKNEQLNGEEFVVARPDSSLTQSLEKSSEGVDDAIEKSFLPLPIRIGHWLCGAAGAVFIIAILKILAEDDSVTLSQAYKSASWFFGSAVLA